MAIRAAIALLRESIQKRPIAYYPCGHHLKYGNA